MPFRFHVPLPGPFSYSRSIGGTTRKPTEAEQAAARERRARRAQNRDDMRTVASALREERQARKRRLEAAPKGPERDTVRATLRGEQRQDRASARRALMRSMRSATGSEYRRS